MFLGTRGACARNVSDGKEYITVRDGPWTERAQRVTNTLKLSIKYKSD